MAPHAIDIREFGEDDLEAELRDLRARGVEIQEYDLPGLKTVDGIADIGFARAAWIVDPHGNALGILQRL